jgi:hypothetical protein
VPGFVGARRALAWLGSVQPAHGKSATSYLGLMRFEFELRRIAW